MADSIYKWSLTPGDNDDADSAVNWRENQLPDTINDSARAMMMRVAEFREDLTGGIVTTGTVPAYLLTTKAAFDSLSDGRWFTCRVHATNPSGTATLNVNGLGARSIRKFGITGDLPVAAGDLQLGGLYQFMYATSANGGAGGWVISNPSTGPSGLAFPAGTIMLFIQAAAPAGWTKQTTHDNKALRVVSGTGGGSAGTTGFTSVFASRTPTGTVDGHVLTLAELAAHAHTQQGAQSMGGISANHYHNVAGGTGGQSVNHTHNAGAQGPTQIQSGNWGSYGAVTGATSGFSADHSHSFNVNSGYVSSDHSHALSLTGDTTSKGSDAAHTHPFTGAAMDFAVSYVDAIICSKD